jgi:hypothetical protein
MLESMPIPKVGEWAWQVKDAGLFMMIVVNYDTEGSTAA